MRTRGGLLAVVVWLVAVAVAIAAPAEVEASTCAVVWGSLAKSTENDVVDPGPPMVDVRAGRHDCYDRLVIDVRGPVADFHVHYVTGVTGLASGEPVPLRGGAFLEVIVGASDRDEAGQLAFPRAGQDELVSVAGFSTFRQVSWAESQEGVTALGVGVRARLPFRVFILAGPGPLSRLVIDVAHRW